MLYTEKKAEEFLKKKGFSVCRSKYIKKESEIKNIRFKFPVVAKISSSKIVHKQKKKGVIKNITSKKELYDAFKRFKKIKGFEGMLIQKQERGNEFFLGLKNTPEFGYCIVVGNMENGKIKDSCFRVCPLSTRDCLEMLKEIKSQIKKISELTKIMKRLCKIGEKNKLIKELDMNVIVNEKAKIVDSQIILD